MSLAPGTRLGPYEILAPLGAGGMGEVYRARDPRLHREVAIKVLPPDMARDPHAITRFEREARAVAALSHPNILAIYDVGSHEGASYLVTELLEGETLHSRVDRSPLPWTKAAEIGAAIADGLAAAHDRGITHRDLKPGNLFLTSDGRVKILDFGLARIQPAPSLGPSPEAPTETEHGAILGTVGYMSPEQVRGQAAEASSDLFSLGCVLYEMVSGKRPFARETGIQTLNAILESDPPPLAASGKDVPPELDALISRCLEKNPAARMQSARDLSFALGELRKRARPVAAGVRRRRFAYSAAAALAAVVLALVAAGLLRDRLFAPARLDRIESLAVLPLDNLSGDPAQDFFADGITEALTTDLGKIGGLRVIARPSVMKFRGTRSSLREIARELRLNALVAGSVLRSGDRVRITAQLIDPEADRQIWSESYERDVRDILALQREITEAIASQVRAKLTPQEQARLVKARPVNPEAYESVLRARYLSVRTTDTDSQAAIALLERAVALDPGFAPGHAELAAAYIRRLMFVAPEQAGELEQKAYAAAERALSLDSDLAEAYLARGDLLWTPSHRFAHARAAQEYRRALSLNPNLDQTHRGLSRVFVHVGFFEEALQHAAQALEINPGNALALSSRAEALLWMGKDEEALATLSGIPRPVLPELVEANTAWTLFRLGKREEARSRLRQASRKYPNDASGVLAGMEAMLLADSEPRKAEELIRRAARRKAVAPSHHAAYFVACAWARMRRAEEAVQSLREAAETGFPCYPLFARDANLDPIRQDARFQAFLADMQKQSESLRKALFPDRR
jgi:TolB-like protein/Tfp pilus assembly protein PilF